MLRSAVLAVLLAGSCPLASTAGDLYKWVDDAGRFHITDDLSQVPAKHRPEARVDVDSAAPPASSGWNSVNVESEAFRLPVAVTQPSSSDESGGEVHVLEVQRAGRAIRVGARLNGNLVAPYIVDTGASINTIPRAVVDRIGLDIDASTPTTFVAGIGGKGMKVPVVTLRSVQIGSAVVENVEMAVLDTMNEGLLGMPFFNHFRVSLDPMAGTLTLEEIDLESIEGIYGGYDESTWRAKFGMVRRQIEITELRERVTPDESHIMRSELAERAEYWRRQLQLLERKATQAGVPRTWRE